jgi:hypothetical protein
MTWFCIDRLLILCEIDIVRVIHLRRMRVVPVGLKNLHQSIRFRIRQNIQNDRVDQTEHGRVHTNPEGQDYYRGDGESGRLQEKAKGVAEVGHGAVKGER